MKGGFVKWRFSNCGWQLLDLLFSNETDNNNNKIKHSCGCLFFVFCSLSCVGPSACIAVAARRGEVFISTEQPLSVVRRPSYLPCHKLPPRGVLSTTANHTHTHTPSYSVFLPEILRYTNPPSPRPGWPRTHVCLLIHSH